MPRSSLVQGRHMKRGWTPVRAIVRLQKQVLRYQGSICQACVSMRRTLALWKTDGRDGTSVKGACVSARFKCKTSSRGRDFTFEGQGRCNRNLLQVNTCCFSVWSTLTENIPRLNAGNWQGIHWLIGKCHQHISPFHWFPSSVTIYDSTCKLESMSFESSHSIRRHPHSLRPARCCCECSSSKLNAASESSFCELRESQQTKDAAARSLNSIPNRPCFTDQKIPLSCQGALS